MELKEIGNKKFLDKGTTAKCYLLKDGNVLKLFNTPKTLDEINRFKYFLNYENDSFVFPFEFIYDSKKFYGYITKYVRGNILDSEFEKSDLLGLSKNSLKLETNIDFVSEGGIVLYDFHSGNLIYDENNFSAIDHDENGINNDLKYTKDTNHRLHRVMIGNLFLDNIESSIHTKYILDKIEKYKYISIKPSEMIIEVKQDLEKYFKENINTLEELNNIVRR